MKADVVIGTNYGDEGKGLVTDYLGYRNHVLLNQETVVVRYCGGPQAGHTVVTPEGERHVFSHFGSGSLLEIPTYLGKHFVVNPSAFRKEYLELMVMRKRALLFAHPECPLTTPYDMLINRAYGMGPGRVPRGSSGLGVNETIERCSHVGFSTQYDDVLGLDTLSKKLDLIASVWLPVRLAALDVDEQTRKFILGLSTKDLRDQFLEDCRFMRKEVIASDPRFLKRSTDKLVFEGSAGLMLDQHFGQFPHITRTSTGLRNVVEMAEEIGIDEMDVHYVTRTYLTRHGKGPMNNETTGKPYSRIREDTVEDKLWKGETRYGYIDLARIAEILDFDRAYALVPDHIHIRRHLVMTCFDQIDGEAVWLEGGTQHQGRDPDIMLGRLLRLTKADQAYKSYGPTRDDVKPFY